MKLQHKLFVALAAAALPVIIHAFSSGPPVRRSGVPTDDNGATCVACHRGNEVNLAPGFVRIDAAPFRSNQSQTIRVTVSHPEAKRWGFQLTARLARDLNAKAGSFRFEQGSATRIACGNSQVLVSPDQTCPADQVEFVSHGGTTDSTFGGVNGAKTYEFNWTAPNADLGDVVFYASGNAADNNGFNNGDRIYTTVLRLQEENTCNFLTRPRVQGMGNAATSRAAISANSLLSLYGADFVPSGISRTADAGIIRDNRFPTELSCVAVEIGGQRAPVYSVQQDQVNVQVPSLSQVGPVPVRVIINPGRPSQATVEAGSITLSTPAPAFFTFTGGSSIAARYPDGRIVADPALVQGGRRITPGEVISLYANALGATSPDTLQAGVISSTTQLYRLNGTLTLTIGGIIVPASDITFAGLAPGAISGLYQINVKVPTGLEGGDVPVSMTIGGATSPSGTTLPLVIR